MIKYKLIQELNVLKTSNITSEDIDNFMLELNALCKYDAVNNKDLKDCLQLLIYICEIKNIPCHDIRVTYKIIK